MSDININIANDEKQILLCFPAIKELRPHLNEESFIKQLARQKEQGYKLLFIEKNNMAVSLLGYRIQEYLAWGKILYIDDFVTMSDFHNRGYGSKLINHAIKTAKENKCHQIHLDSGHSREDAHRLYLNKGFRISSHHFSMKL